MKNKKEILNNLYNNIVNISDSKINIYIEEISEKQIEYYYNSKTLKKYNKYYGVNIDIKTSKVTYFDKFQFADYIEMANKIYAILNKLVDSKFLRYQNQKSVTKIIKTKCATLSNSKKNRIYKYIKEKINYIDNFKLSFYEKKENIFILSNKQNSILNIRNFYSKIMLRSTYNKIESFDHLLFTSGYLGLNKNKLAAFIERYNYNNFIKYNSESLEDGIYDLILSNRCGTVFHEMFGHNLERDLIKLIDKKIFEIGQYVGNNLITYVDDPKVKNLLNISYNCYGNKRTKKVLIKDGKVIDFLKNDSVRIENYNYFPMTRMSNSYLKPIRNLEEINLGKLKKVIYIEKIKNGRLDVEKQKFKIEIDCAILFENGVLKSYLSNISFVVDISNFIKKIKSVGNDLNFVPTVCGSKSGNIFVFAGCPTVFVTNINIKQNVQISK